MDLHAWNTPTPTHTCAHTHACTPPPHTHPHVQVMELDLASLASVRRFLVVWGSDKATARPLHILINNAGIYSMAAPREQTEDDFESHMGSNHLGHFLLTLGLMAALQAGAAGQPR